MIFVGGKDFYYKKTALKKVVSNGLISRIEDLEAENETLQEKLKTDIRKLKTQYEEDKWQQISGIFAL